ncbi:hypothetical protein FH972_002400 [Carpinus fangiana]|uniref:Uncharacterized protein n=1 Tax=Carpinus fangiana TaxID=176857 RepID=A0A5N6QF35_9ROSI|nr:hypothetical protein FH972_002400 [Carpinus fangiana]
MSNPATKASQDNNEHSHTAHCFLTTKSLKHSPKCVALFHNTCLLQATRNSLLVASNHGIKQHFWQSLALPSLLCPQLTLELKLQPSFLS